MTADYQRMHVLARKGPKPLACDTHAQRRSDKDQDDAPAHPSCNDAPQNGAPISLRRAAAVKHAAARSLRHVQFVGLQCQLRQVVCEVNGGKPGKEQGDQRQQVRPIQKDFVRAQQERIETRQVPLRQPEHDTRNQQDQHDLGDAVAGRAAQPLIRDAPARWSTSRR